MVTVDMMKMLREGGELLLVRAKKLAPPDDTKRVP